MQIPQYNKQLSHCSYAGFEPLAVMTVDDITRLHFLAKLAFDHCQPMQWESVFVITVVCVQHFWPHL